MSLLSQPHSAIYLKPDLHIILHQPLTRPLTGSEPGLSARNQIPIYGGHRIVSQTRQTSNVPVFVFSV